MDIIIVKYVGKKFLARQNQRNNRGRKFENKKAEAPVAPVAEAAPVAEEAQADAE